MIAALTRRHGRLIASALTHESAHCVIGFRLGVTPVSIHVKADGHGLTEYQSLARVTRFKNAVISLTGPAAEVRAGFSTAFQWLSARGRSRDCHIRAPCRKARSFAMTNLGHFSGLEPG